MQAEATRQNLPARGIEPHRGSERPIVLTTGNAGRTTGCPIELSVTSTADTLGVKTCTVCEAIRMRRLVRGRVIRYLDHVKDMGVAEDGLFHFSELTLPFGPSEMQVLAQSPLAELLKREMAAGTNWAASE